MIRFFLEKFLNGFADWLPVTVLSRTPSILIAFEQDFIRHAENIRVALGSRDETCIFLHLGYECETDLAADTLCASLQMTLKNWQDLRLIILCNAQKELEQFCKRGFEALLCHQNAFLDESFYRILKTPTVYDAVYLARVTPFKRYELAANISNLLVIGVFSDVEKEYALQTLKAIPFKKRIEKIFSFQVPKWFARARCGLCLSAAEGAMYVSAEYLLCGLPIVDTPALGGRSRLFPDFAVQTVEATPEAVAEGVRYWQEHPVDPDSVRESVIAKMKSERDAFIEYVQKLLDEKGENRNFREEFNTLFHHKWGLRCRVWLWQRLKTGLARRKLK